jgi:Holliday junction resolvase-like predicted endonuclease
MQLESKVQAKVIKQLEAQGYYVLKLLKTNKNGIMDLIAIKPNEVYFVEVKRKGGKLSPLQEYRIKELRDLGFKVDVFYGE